MLEKGTVHKSTLLNISCYLMFWKNSGEGGKGGINRGKVCCVVLRCQWADDTLGRKPWSSRHLQTVSCCWRSSEEKRRVPTYIRIHTHIHTVEYIVGLLPTVPYEERQSSRAVQSARQSLPLSLFFRSYRQPLISLYGSVYTTWLVLESI